MSWESQSQLNLSAGKVQGWKYHKGAFLCSPCTSTCSYSLKTVVWGRGELLCVPHLSPKAAAIGSRVIRRDLKGALCLEILR